MSETDIKIVAVVKFNDGEAWVLNRKVRFLYEFVGEDLIGSDGPFRTALRHEKPFGRFKAFAGRKFSVPLKDGGHVECSGQYWDAGLSGYTHITYSTIDDLKRCYVYGGAMIDPAFGAALRAEYTGCVYPYYDYEKVIKFDDARRASWDRISKLERDKKHLIKSVKSAHSALREATNA